MDDVCREILYFLPPRDFYTILEVNQYWHSLPDEHFYKTKLEREYPFIDSCYQGLSYSERYRLLSSPKQRVEQLFGHVREGRTQFKSELFVGDLFKESKEFTLFVVILCAYDQYADYDCYFDLIDRLGNIHCGDCICIPASCDLCYFEGIISDAIEKLNKWRNLVGVEGSLLELCSVIYSTTPVYQSRKEAPFWMTLEEEYQHWLSLTKEEQKEIRDEVSKLNSISN